MDNGEDEMGNQTTRKSSNSVGSARNPRTKDLKRSALEHLERVGTTSAPEEGNKIYGSKEVCINPSENKGEIKFGY